MFLVYRIKTQPLRVSSIINRYKTKELYISVNNFTKQYTFFMP